MDTHTSGLSTETFARAIGLRPDSIRVTLCRRGDYYGLTPAKLPNGRLLWPVDAVDRLIKGGRVKSPHASDNTA